MLFSEFIKINRISIIVPSMRLSSHRFASLINDKLSNSFVSDNIPEENDSDILIIVPTNEQIFRELHHSKLTKKNYKKFPTSIVIVLGFDMMVKINDIFNNMVILSNYKIPVLYSPMLESIVEVQFKLIDRKSYNDSLIFNKSDENIHLTNPHNFNNSLSVMLDENNQEKYMIHCYYTNGTNEKQLWKDKIEVFDNIMSLYSKLTLNDGKQLILEDNELLTI